MYDFEAVCSKPQTVTAVTNKQLCLMDKEIYRRYPLSFIDCSSKCLTQLQLKSQLTHLWDTQTFFLSFPYKQMNNLLLSICNHCSITRRDQDTISDQISHESLLRRCSVRTAGEVKPVKQVGGGAVSGCFNTWIFFL